jgi:hypothetical protein
MAAKRRIAASNGHSFITTGGTWVPPQGGDGVCAEVPGHWIGGTQEPGRFTAALAPMPANPFLSAPRAERVPPSPDYSTPEAITMRARERGATPLTQWLPLQGEELGVKFVKRLRELAPAEWGSWERDSIPTATRAPVMAGR